MLKRAPGVFPGGDELVFRVAIGGRVAESDSSGPSLQAPSTVCSPCCSVVLASNLFPTYGGGPFCIALRDAHIRNECTPPTVASTLCCSRSQRVQPRVWVCANQPTRTLQSVRLTESIESRAAYFPSRCRSDAFLGTPQVCGTLRVRGAKFRRLPADALLQGGATFARRRRLQFRCRSHVTGGLQAAFLSSLLYMIECGGPRAMATALVADIASNGREWVQLALPAFLYTLQNNALYLGLTYLEACDCDHISRPRYSPPPYFRYTCLDDVSTAASGWRSYYLWWVCSSCKECRRDCIPASDASTTAPRGPWPGSWSAPAAQPWCVAVFGIEAVVRARHIARSPRRRSALHYWCRCHTRCMRLLLVCRSLF